MGLLIPPETFLKWQVVFINRKGFDRVVQLRAESMELFPPITPEMGAAFNAKVAEFQQIDMNLTYLLDMFGLDGIDCDKDKPEPPVPGAA